MRTLKFEKHCCDGLVLIPQGRENSRGEILNRPWLFPFSEIPVVRVNSDREDGSVLLTCESPDKDVKWFKDGKEIKSHEKNKNIQNLGSSIKDPQGIYWCQGSKNRSRTLQVYFRSM